MPTPAVLAVAIIAVAIAVLLTSRARPDVVGLTAALALGVVGVLTADEVFAGFSRSSVVTIMAVFVLADGLRRAGVTDALAALLLRFGGRREPRLVATLMLTGAALSLFMNNIAAASVVLPIVPSAARRTGVRPSRLLMPLAFGTTLGGMATLLTTTNIVVSGALRDRGLAAFGLLDFAPVGGALALCGIAYMTLFGRRRLPAHDLGGPDGPDAQALLELYGIPERLLRLRVPDGTFLHGRTLTESTIRERFDAHVIAVERDGDVTHAPSPDFVLRAGDVLVVQGRLEDLVARDVAPYFEVLPVGGWAKGALAEGDAVVLEAVLAPRSALIGQTLRTAHFRAKYGFNTLSIWRRGAPLAAGLADQPLRFGDALLLRGPAANIAALRTEPGLILLAEPDVLAAEPPLVAWRGRLALGVFVGTVLLAALDIRPVSEVMFAGALLMVMLGMLSMDQAYQAIEWKTVFVVAGMLPLGIALTKTGAATAAADAVVGALGALGPRAVLAGLVVVTVLLAQVMHGAAVATIMAPIALDAAAVVHADPRAMALGVAIATSMAFITPLGHPVNLLVMSAGGYRGRDFAVVGAPLVALLVPLLLVLLPWWMPLIQP
ncbi:MAG: SLC13 family permease [Ardenticatenales bacterium]|nr:SLC13 family permease [Ardenticatenales bacterium]